MRPGCSVGAPSSLGRCGRHANAGFQACSKRRVLKGGRLMVSPRGWMVSLDSAYLDLALREKFAAANGDAVVVAKVPSPFLYPTLSPLTLSPWPTSLAEPCPE